jgi:hypothetical protein
MKNWLIVILMIFVTGSAALSPLVFAQEEEAGMFDEDAPRFTEEQRSQIKRLNEEYQAITDPIARRDGRYPQYLADLEELNNIRDPRIFAEKYAAFQTNWEDFQREVLRAAGVTERDYNLRLQQILPHLRLDEEGRIINDKSEPAPAGLKVPKRGAYRKDSVYFLKATEQTFETTDFSQKWSIKDCSQADVEFPTSKSFRVSGLTDIMDADCDDVKAARGTIINVPSGVKKVRVEIFLDKYRIASHAIAYGYFAYANAYSAVGIRVKGFIANSAKQTNYFRHKYRDVSWSVLGDDEATVEETDVRMVCSFIPLVPGDFHIQAYGRIAVDTDGFGLAQATSDVTGLQKMKITFFK